MPGRAATGLIAALMIAAIGCAGKVPLPEGRRAPYTRFTLMDGEMVSSASLRGKTTVLLFWSVQCPHSRRLIRAIGRLAARHRDMTNVAFLCVNVDRADDIAAVKGYIEEYKLESMNHAFSGNDIYDEAYMAFDIGQLPYTFIMDPSGYIRADGLGAGEIEDMLSVLSAGGGN